MEEQIISFLSGQKEPLAPAKIAAGIGLKGSKSVNSTLYRLLKLGKLIKLAEADGTRPRWQLNKTGESITSAPSPAVSTIVSTPITPVPLPPLDANILAFLNMATECLSAQAIAINLLGAGSTSKMINSSIYSLLGKGLVEKVIPPDTVQPQWKITGKSLPFSTPTSSKKEKEEIPFVIDL